MKKSVSILLIMAMASVFPLFAQDLSSSLPTPNAAVGYLMAIGFLTPVPEQVMTEINTVENVAALEKLSSKTKNFFTDGKLNTVFKMLIQGAECKECRFGYERTYRADDPVAPFRRLRELARTARVYGLMQLKDGKPDKAFETFKAIFCMGKHVEFDGTLIAGMIGIALKNISLSGFKELVNLSKDKKIVEDACQFLKSQPSATLSAAKYLESEKKYIATALNMIKEDSKKESDEDLRNSYENVVFILPLNMQKNVVSSETNTASPVKSCSANQRVLMGAVEMLCMDYNPMPATLTLSIIPEFLVSSKYLKNFPECPEKGKYEITKTNESAYEWHCTIHPEPGVTSEPASDTSVYPSKSQIEEFKKFINSTEFDKMTAEALGMFDEAKKFDPYAADYTAKIDAFQKKIETSTNTIIKNAIPNFKKMFESQVKQDESIKKLISR
ncbi:MAG: hypothetical protein HQM10_03450 [Candidatus Riflebacteria bacterium]|nr:hypothetical protein [Candidatus Riflebacteria bacterium]